MKRVFIFMLLLLPLKIFSQLEVTIATDKTNLSKNDSIWIAYTIRNTGSETVTYRMEEHFHLLLKNEFSRSHCFSVDKTENYSLTSDPSRDKSAFIIIKPGEEITESGYFGVYWLCRNAPPRGVLQFDLVFSRSITNEDNYYLFESYYSGKQEKIFVDAWVGELTSNSIEITAE